MKRLALVAALMVPVVARADAPPDVTALFEQGLEDMKSGKLDVACKEMAAALAKYDDSGIRGALATCYTKQGKTASAWTLWKNLADTAKPEDRADALSRAKALEPLLARYQIQVQGTAPAGLVVTINGQAVAEPTIAVAIPVDPGPIAVVAKAPGKADYTTTLQATQAKTTTVEIPALKDAGASGGVAVPPPNHGNGDKLPEGPLPPPEGSGHTMAFVVGGVGLLGLATGGVFGFAANNSWSKARDTDCGGDINQCVGASGVQAQKDVDDARSKALISDIAFGVGAVAVIGGVVLYMRASKKEKASPTALHVRPAVDATQAGIVLSGGW